MISLLVSMVALRKESVDRNPINVMSVSAVQVALRKESVDRNDAVCANNHKRRVALRKESVDRNFSAGTKVPLSKRRSPQGERG